jgi:hypothetical protein
LRLTESPAVAGNDAGADAPGAVDAGDADGIVAAFAIDEEITDAGIGGAVDGEGLIVH